MATFQIFSAEEIEALRKGGKILRDCLRRVSTLVHPGVTTESLDKAAEEFILSHEGARSAFKGYHEYPATLCTSVNEQCVHGIPGSRILKQGDIVSLDCGVIYGGLYTDACVTVPVGDIPEDVSRFLQVTEEALEKACALVQAGVRIGDISSLIQETVEAAGWKTIRGLTGHGLGTTLHQFPDIPNQGKAGTGSTVPAGTTLAIEPITSMGSPEIVEEGDGWTLRTRDRAYAAHEEHTVLVTEQGAEILA